MGMQRPPEAWRGKLSLRRRGLGERHPPRVGIILAGSRKSGVMPKMVEIRYRPRNVPSKTRECSYVASQSEHPSPKRKEI